MHGLIKLSLLVLANLPLWVFGWPIEPKGLISPSLFYFIVSIIGIPVYYLKNNRQGKLSWPKWNNSLFKPSGNPLANVDFYGLMFLTLGVNIIIQSQTTFGVPSKIGQSSIALGLGMLLGLGITLLINRTHRIK